MLWSNQILVYEDCMRNEEEAWKQSVEPLWNLGSRSALQCIQAALRTHSIMLSSEPRTWLQLLPINHWEHTDVQTSFLYHGVVIVSWQSLLIFLSCIKMYPSNQGNMDIKCINQINIYNRFIKPAKYKKSHMCFCLQKNRKRATNQENTPANNYSVPFKVQFH